MRGSGRPAPVVFRPHGRMKTEMSPSSEILQLGPVALGAIRREAIAAYPRECCGALLGHAGHVEAAVPLPNAAEESSQSRFLIGPEGYREAERRAAATGSALLGFYHSHPDHDAQPSREDLEDAWPNLLYLIVSVSRDGVGEVRGWWLTEDRARFLETEIDVASILQSEI